MITLPMTESMTESLGIATAQSTIPQDIAQCEEVQACGVHFDGDFLVIELSDERQISLPFTKLKWLRWLAKATPEQRADWSIEPHGYAVWWDELDDGIEVAHALSLRPMPHARNNHHA